MKSRRKWPWLVAAGYALSGLYVWRLFRAAEHRPWVDQ